MEKENIKNIVIGILGIGIIFLIYSNYFQRNNQNIIFENNIKCSKYIKQVEENNRDTKGMTKSEIFYSPKMKTCISAYTQYDKSSFRIFIINNILTNEEIFLEGGGKETFTTLKKNRELFENRIKELKEEE